MISLLFLLVVVPVPEDYRLQIGDEVAITVSGKINFTYSQLISPEGNIFIQSGGVALRSPESEEVVPAGATVLGIVKVLDLTLEEARELAEEEFKKYFKGIRVFLTIVKFEDVVYVDGAVTLPGAYPFFYGKRARDYIGSAGGALESGDLENVKITTPKNEVINGDLDAIPLRNSVISVPYAFVYVRGEVKKPGNFPYDPRMEALQYIGMAGGPTERANLQKSYVIKKGGEEVSIAEVRIDKGDIIVVPRLFLKWWEDYIAIAGSVVPTIYLFTLIRNALGWGE